MTNVYSLWVEAILITINKPILNNMKNSILATLLLLLTFFSTFSQIGIFEKAEDIGNPAIMGSSSYENDHS